VVFDILVPSARTGALAILTDIVQDTPAKMSLAVNTGACVKHPCEAGYVCGETPEWIDGNGLYSCTCPTGSVLCTADDNSDPSADASGTPTDKTLAAESSAVTDDGPPIVIIAAAGGGGMFLLILCVIILRYRAAAKSQVVPSEVLADFPFGLAYQVDEATWDDDMEVQEEIKEAPVVEPVRVGKKLRPKKDRPPRRPRSRGFDDGGEIGNTSPVHSPHSEVWSSTDSGRDSPLVSASNRDRKSRLRSASVSYTSEGAAGVTGRRRNRRASVEEFTGDLDTPVTTSSHHVSSHHGSSHRRQSVNGGSSRRQSVSGRRQSGTQELQPDMARAVAEVDRHQPPGMQKPKRMRRGSVKELVDSGEPSPSVGRRQSVSSSRRQSVSGGGSSRSHGNEESQRAPGRHRRGSVKEVAPDSERPAAALAEPKRRMRRGSVKEVSDTGGAPSPAHAGEPKRRLRRGSVKEVQDSSTSLRSPSSIKVVSADIDFHAPPPEPESVVMKRRLRRGSVRETV
jgi:hypothetical protein